MPSFAEKTRIKIKTESAANKSTKVNQIREEISEANKSKRMSPKSMGRAYADLAEMYKSQQERKTRANKGGKNKKTKKTKAKTRHKR